MKKILILLTIVVGICATVFSQVKVFHELAGLPGVETVFIGKAAMQIASRSINTGDKFIPKDAIRSMEGMEVISVDNAETMESVRPVLQRIIQEGSYEPLIESKGEGETSSIYTIMPPEGEDAGICHNLLIVSEEPWELNIVLIKGSFNLDRIVSVNMSNAVSHPHGL